MDSEGNLLMKHIYNLSLNNLLPLIKYYFNICKIKIN